jgi:DNA-binding beta-propeller fold protein YncE
MGPGDIGTYFPLEPGITWTYDVTKTEFGSPRIEYEKEVRTKMVAFKGGYDNLTVFKERSSAESQIHERFFGKEPYNLPATLSSRLMEFEFYHEDLLVSHAPYPVAFFPPVVGSKHAQFVNSTFVQDLDGDGYSGDYTTTSSYLTVLGFETVSVPAGTFTNVLRIETERSLEIESEYDGNRLSRTTTVTEWFAQGAGLIKKTAHIKSSNGSVTTSEVILEELTAVVGLDLPTTDGIKIVPVLVKDMVYDKFNDRIYATVPSTEHRIGNTVTVIDPDTATIQSSVPVGSEPGPLSLSHDGQLLYVGLHDVAAISVVDVPSMTVDLQFSVGDGPVSRSTLVANDIEVSPDDPSVIAVSTLWQDNETAHEGVAVFDRGERRPVMSDYFSAVDEIEFSNSGDVVYGYISATRGSIDEGLRTLAVDKNGVTESDVTHGLLMNALDIEFGRGLIFSTSGEVIDPEAKALLGNFNLDVEYGGADLVEPDVARSRVYFLIYRRLVAFDLKTFKLVGEITLPRGGYEDDIFPRSLIRVGDEQLAVAIGKNIYLIKIDALQ